MHSIEGIFRIGIGPSSSHTMGPEKACLRIMAKYPEADHFRVTLFGSLSRTGRGHGTDRAVLKTLGEERAEIVWDMSDTPLPHPNTMDVEVFQGENLLKRERVISVGGGAIRFDGDKPNPDREVYPASTFDAIRAECERDHITIADYVYRYEPEVRSHLEKVWAQMQKTVQAGLQADGELPGGLHVQRRAGDMMRRALRDRDLLKKGHFMAAAYAYAACEENAAGGRMVTAPTCGACGVVPAVLCYEKQLFGCSDEEIRDALAVAGLVGQIIRVNASVSGAEAGCQAEVGSACSMASAALAHLHGLNLAQVECAAEMAMEHCLGLTCDPVGGLVQIPCIERNAAGALRSLNAANLAEVNWENRKVSFDTVVATMYQTGKDLSRCYRETSEGGLAKLYTGKLR